MICVFCSEKAYGSSAYFEDPDSKYPTVEEQVKLCKAVAQTLTSADNLSSRGSKMFFKRKKRSNKWTVSNMPLDDEDAEESGSDKEPPLSPESARITREGVPKFLLKPSAFDEMKDREHIELSDHSFVKPQKCFDLANQLKSQTTGRGAKLFQRRVEKSEKWIHDESTMPQQLKLPGAAESKPTAVPAHLETVDGQTVEYGEKFNVNPKGWQPSGKIFSRMT